LNFFYRIDSEWEEFKKPERLDIFLFYLQYKVVESSSGKLISGEPTKLFVMTLIRYIRKNVCGNMSFDAKNVAIFFVRYKHGVAITILVVTKFDCGIKIPKK